MKTKFLIFAFAVLSFSFVNAQTFQELGEMARTQTEQMISKLDLTDNQQEMIYRQNYVWLEEKSKYAKIEVKTETHRQFLNDSKSNYIKNVTKMLTDEQRATFRSWLKESKFLEF